MSLYGVNGNGRELASRADIIFRFIHQQRRLQRRKASSILIKSFYHAGTVTLNIHPNTHPFFLCTLVDCHDLGL